MTPRAVAAAMAVALMLATCVRSEVTAGLEVVAERASGVNTSVHAFYYTWYDGPWEGNGWNEAYVHWDHRVLCHWDERQRRAEHNCGLFTPAPGDVASPYYPARGPYASADPAVIAGHVADCVQAGVGVLVYGWTGQVSNPRAVDGEGVNTDVLVHAVMDVLDAVHSPVTLAWHIEPYEGRSAASVADDLEYLRANYWGRDHVYTIDGRPVVYLYDSYRTPASEWATVFARPGGSVRGTPADAFVFGLCLDRGCVAELAAAGFDGLYTYFAADAFSYGSTTSQWRALVADAHAAGLRVSLSIGPGYDDTRIRPWNAHNLRPRNNGAYYDAMAAAAIAAGTDYLSITSYNEWGEGTQIEPAVPRSGTFHASYEGYGDQYLEQTAAIVARFAAPRPPPHQPQTHGQHA